MEQPLISIIVPVYNAEPYLDNCLDSIAAQTWGNLEVWLVDDGSTDASPALCDARAAADSRFHVLHQANERIVEAAARRLKEPMEKFPMTISKYGNTSSASIPLLLNDMAEKHMLQPGDKIILSGFGAGMTWGAVLMEW